MQSGIPNHYPKFSKLHQFAYIIEPHHQKKGRCDQRKLGHQPHPNIYMYIYVYIYQYITLCIYIYIYIRVRLMPQLSLITSTFFLVVRFNDISKLVKFREFWIMVRYAGLHLNFLQYYNNMESLLIGLAPQELQLKKK